MIHSRRSSPPWPSGLRALAVSALALTPWLCSAQPDSAALLAADPATAAPALAPADPSPARPALDGNTPLDLREALARWRRVNDAVGAFPRGHIDLLRWEARNAGAASAAPAATSSPPPASLSQDEAVALALAGRPDLMERPGASEPERLAQRQDRMALAYTVRRAWIDAVAAQAGLRLQAARLEGARIGSDLGQRMVEAGNWSQSRWLREQLKQAREHAAWMQARQAAHGATEALARLLGLWAAADVHALPARLPPELPSVPAPVATTTATEADVLASAPAWSLHAEQVRRQLAGVSTAQRQAWNAALAQARSVAPNQPPAVTDPRLLNDHALQRAVQAEASLLQAAAERRSWAREAWTQLQTAQASARHAQDELLPLLQAAEQEALLRYNGMLLSTWDVLAAAHERLLGTEQALQARQRYWQALTDWQTLLAGGGYSPAAAGQSASTGSNTPDGDH